MQNGLSEPLPLVEKGKYNDIQRPKFILVKSQKQSYIGQNGVLGVKEGRNYSQIQLTIDQLNLFCVEDNKQQNWDVLQHDHQCIVNPDNQRCQICNCTMKFFFHSNYPSKQPYEVQYIDFLPTFYKKMELHLAGQKDRFKKFYCINNLLALKIWTYYILDRKLGYGMDDFINHDQNLVPKMLRNYGEKIGVESFNNIKILGDFEGANIGPCTINKTQDKVSFLLKSDTNTKGCMHWFMFGVQAKEECTVTFSILNNKRNGQLYKDGMLIAIYDCNQPDRGWYRGGKQIFYYRSNVDHDYYKVDNDMLVSITQNNQNNFGSSQQFMENPCKKDDNITNIQSNINENQDVQMNCGLTSQNIANQASNQNLLGNNSLILGDRPSYSVFQPAVSTVINSTNTNGNSIPQQKQQPFQTLDFNFTFKAPDQRVIFAYSYPYTFTDLCQFLQNEEEKLLRSMVERQYLDLDSRSLRIKTNLIYYKKKTISGSRLGLPIFQISITANRRQGAMHRRKRKVVFFIARQHPGETPSSFVCQGIIKFLLTDKPQSKLLRELYIFKIIPMVNPDGVVLGNSRCSLSGLDLNRRWQNPCMTACPEVYYIKEQLKKTFKKREIHIFADLHGHSQKKQCFLYGCNKTSDSGGQITWTKARLIPRILSKLLSFFNLEDCKFRVTEDKVSTARVVAWSEFKIDNSFTLETSFYGYPDAKDYSKVEHYTCEDLQKIGETLCLCIMEYSIVFENLQRELIESKGKLKPIKPKEVPQISNPNSDIKKRSGQSISGVVNNAGSNNSASVEPGFNEEKDQKERRLSQLKKFSSEKKEKKSCSGQRSANQNYKKQKNGTVGAQTSNNEQFLPNQIGNRQHSQQNNGSSIQQITINSNQQKLKKNGSELINQQHDNSFEKQKEYKIFGLTNKYIHNLCPNLQSDWRDYFQKDELVKNFKQIEEGCDPNDQESLSGSDSDPEADLIKENVQEEDEEVNNEDQEGDQQDKEDKNNDKKNTDNKRPLWKPSPVVQTEYSQNSQIAKGPIIQQQQVALKKCSPSKRGVINSKTNTITNNPSNAQQNNERQSQALNNQRDSTRQSKKSNTINNLSEPGRTDTQQGQYIQQEQQIIQNLQIEQDIEVQKWSNFQLAQQIQLQQQQQVKQQNKSQNEAFSDVFNSIQNNNKNYEQRENIMTTESLNFNNNNMFMKSQQFEQDMDVESIENYDNLEKQFLEDQELNEDQQNNQQDVNYDYCNVEEQPQEEDEFGHFQDGKQFNEQQQAEIHVKQCQIDQFNHCFPFKPIQIQQYQTNGIDCVNNIDQKQKLMMQHYQDCQLQQLNYNMFQQPQQQISYQNMDELTQQQQQMLQQQLQLSDSEHQTDYTTLNYLTQRSHNKKASSIPRSAQPSKPKTFDQGKTIATSNMINELQNSTQKSVIVMFPSLISSKTPDQSPNMKKNEQQYQYVNIINLYPRQQQQEKLVIYKTNKIGLNTQTKRGDDSSASPKIDKTHHKRPFEQNETSNNINNTQPTKSNIPEAYEQITNDGMSINMKLQNNNNNNKRIQQQQLYKDSQQFQNSELQAKKHLSIQADRSSTSTNMSRSNKNFMQQNSGQQQNHYSRKNSKDFQDKKCMSASKTQKKSEKLMQQLMDMPTDLYQYKTAGKKETKSAFKGQPGVNDLVYNNCMFMKRENNIQSPQSLTTHHQPNQHGPHQIRQPRIKIHPHKPFSDQIQIYQGNQNQRKAEYASPEIRSKMSNESCQIYKKLAKEQEINESAYRQQIALDNIQNELDKKIHCSPNPKKVVNQSYIKKKSYN